MAKTTTLVVPFSERINARHILGVSCRLPWTPRHLIFTDSAQAANVMVWSLRRKSQPDLCLLAPVILSARPPFPGEWFTPGGLRTDLQLWPTRIDAEEPLELTLTAKVAGQLSGSIVAEVEAYK